MKTTVAVALTNQPLHNREMSNHIEHDFFIYVREMYRLDLKNGECSTDCDENYVCAGIIYEIQFAATANTNFILIAIDMALGNLKKLSFV